MENGHAVSYPNMRFERNADRTLGKVKVIFTQRGAEYSDTWEDGQWLALIAVARRMGIKLSKEQARRLAAAALFDVKYARLSGGYKEDTVIDAIAYAANFAAEEAENETQPQMVPDRKKSERPPDTADPSK